MKSGPGLAKPDPFEVPEALTWPVFVASAPAWLAPYLSPGPTDNPPLAVSPLHPLAVGSYAIATPDGGLGAIEWIEQAEGKTLRWWQRIATVLKLQHDAAGRLLKRTVTETAPRRAGKSVGIRGLALWRQANGAELFGERQEIIHTGSDMAVCRKCQKEAWRWAEGQSWTVTRGNGKEAIENPGGDVWLVRAQRATYGWDTTLALVDEGWDVEPETVDEGLAPSLMGRQSPQLVQTSTSHRRATSVMPSAIAEALANDDPSILLLWWGARPSDDPGDPETWRKASPYWDADRAEIVGSMYRKAERGEEDPELDDPDPMAGFASQFLNRWSVRVPAAPGVPVITEANWAALAAPMPIDGTPDPHLADGAPGAPDAPDSVAVEAWFGDGVAVAEAWKSAHGPVLVRVTDHPDLDAAAAYAATLTLRRPVLVGASLAEHESWKRNKVRVTKAQGTTRAAVGELMRSLAGESARFVHDGGELLSEQVLALRTSPGADGPRIRSTGRADAVKALVWAVGEAAAIRRGVVVPSRFKVAASA